MESADLVLDGRNVLLLLPREQPHGGPRQLLARPLGVALVQLAHGRARAGTLVNVYLHGSVNHPAPLA